MVKLNELTNLMATEAQLVINGLETTLEKSADALKGALDGLDVEKAREAYQQVIASLRALADEYKEQATRSPEPEIWLSNSGSLEKKIPPIEEELRLLEARGAAVLTKLQFWTATTEFQTPDQDDLAVRASTETGQEVN